MDSRGRRRRNWIIFWLALVGIPILAWVAFGAFLDLTNAFLDTPSG